MGNEGAIFPICKSVNVRTLIASRACDESLMTPKAFVIAGPSSGVGKTTVTLGIMAGASRLLADAVDIRIIQLMLGHASLQQTQRYLNVTDEELRKGLEVSWSGGSGGVGKPAAPPHGRGTDVVLRATADAADRPPPVAR
jgi:hypothetical protein